MEAFNLVALFAGMSRNESVKNRSNYYSNFGQSPIENKDNTYVKEINDDGSQQNVSGWRIFDINESNGEITLISAGCPENYYIYLIGGDSASKEPAFENEYILTGEINSNWGDMTEEIVQEKYTKRNWDMYVNKNQKAVNARILTKEDLDYWYEKYMQSSSFSKIYDTKYQTLIDNNADYWLSQASDSRIGGFYYLWHMYEDVCSINDYQGG